MRGQGAGGLRQARRWREGWNWVPASQRRLKHQTCVRRFKSSGDGDGHRQVRSRVALPSILLLAYFCALCPVTFPNIYLFSTLLYYLRNAQARRLPRRLLRRLPRRALMAGVQYLIN